MLRTLGSFGVDVADPPPRIVHNQGRSSFHSARHNEHHLSIRYANIIHVRVPCYMCQIIKI